MIVQNDTWKNIRNESVISRDIYLYHSYSIFGLKLSATNFVDR